LIRLTVQIPLSVHQILAHVHVLAVGLQVQLGAVIRPRAEFEETVLFVERKPSDVDLARDLKDARWDPIDLSKDSVS